uniref:Uncharacterized protein n=1 Tax=Trichuris muris TaxID=70415 RepID=A0A5S6Q319_TRIMR
MDRRCPCLLLAIRAGYPSGFANFVFPHCSSVMDIDPPFVFLRMAHDVVGALKCTFKTHFFARCIPVADRPWRSEVSVGRKLRRSANRPQGRNGCVRFERGPTRNVSTCTYKSGRLRDRPSGRATALTKSPKSGKKVAALRRRPTELVLSRLETTSLLVILLQHIALLLN